MLIPCSDESDAMDPGTSEQIIGSECNLCCLPSITGWCWSSMPEVLGSAVLCQRDQHAKAHAWNHLERPWEIKSPHHSARRSERVNIRGTALHDMGCLQHTCLGSAPRLL